MEELGIVNQRTILYQRHSFTVNWGDQFPQRNWLLLVVVEGKSKMILNEISRKAIDRNVCYVCCAGEQSELLHDMIDEEVVFRDVDIENHHLPDHFIVTVWDNSIEKAFWTATYAAVNDEESIQFVICLDASNSGIRSDLIKLISQ